MNKLPENSIHHSSLIPHTFPTHEERDAAQKGAEAYGNQFSKASNPYTNMSPEHAAWNTGYDNAKAADAC